MKTINVKWKYDACGEYFDYKDFVVIRQDHPKLNRYLICTEDNGELKNIGTASTIKEVREFINNRIKEYDSI